MKAINLSRVYESMDTDELAVMTFASLVNGDSAAAKDMAMAVPKYNYYSADKEYVGRLNRIFDVAALWSIEYWKCYARMVASLGLTLQSRQGDHQIHISSTDNLEFIWEGRLCALGQILVSLSNTHNIDIETMLRFSDVQSVYGLDIAPKSLSDDASEYYLSYQAYFESLIDGSNVPDSVKDYFSL